MHREIYHALHDIFLCASRSKNADGILECQIYNYQIIIK